MRRQANTLNFVQFVGGDKPNGKTNENQHDSGGYPCFVRNNIAHQYG